MKSEESFVHGVIEELFSVKEMCKMTDTTRKDLYTYDRVGLLKPVLRLGTQRHKLYSKSELEKLKIIQKYREAGLFLVEIHEFLNCMQIAGIAKEGSSCAASLKGKETKKI